MPKNSKIALIAGVVLCMGILLFPLGVSPQQPHSYIPPDGFVPDKTTAIRIAEAVLTPIYGENKIKQEEPLGAYLNEAGDTWIVSGQLPKPANRGGEAHIEISKADGRIIRVTHGK